VRIPVSEDLILYAGGLLLAVGGSVGQMTLNRLLALVASEFPDVWDSLGRPSGVFSQPRGTARSFSPIYPGWVFAAPNWITQHPRGRQYLVVFRASLLIAALGAILLILGVVLAT
jgi:hypothetical protein